MPVARPRRWQPSEPRATASSSTTPMSSAGANSSAGSRPASRRTTCTPPASSSTPGQEVGAKAGDQAGLDVRAGCAPRGSARRRQDQVSYPTNTIRYDYDRTTNTYLRTVTREDKQIDAATEQTGRAKERRHHAHELRPAQRRQPKHRLEADVIGTGTAWIATNGTTIKGTWRRSPRPTPDPVLRCGRQPGDPDRGQTFVQVMTTGTGKSGAPHGADRVAAAGASPAPRCRGARSPGVWGSSTAGAPPAGQAAPRSSSIRSWMTTNSASTMIRRDIFDWPDPTVAEDDRDLARPGPRRGWPGRSSRSGRHSRRRGCRRTGWPPSVPPARP